MVAGHIDIEMHTAHGGRPLVSRALLTAFLALLVQALALHASSAEQLMEGAQLTQITTDGKSMALYWSWRGNRIAYLRVISDTQTQLRIMNIDGSDDRDVSPVGNPFRTKWSWDDNYLAYKFSNQDEKSSPAGVFIYDIENDRSIPVSPTYTVAALMGMGPYWSADDRQVAYTVEGSGGKDELWVAEAESGKYSRLLSGRGEVSLQGWSPGVPPRLAVLVQASGGVDAATVNPDGTDLTLLTDIGSDTVSIGDLRWSYAGDWVAWLSDLDMRTEEREKGCSDVWIARPDGSEARNLTQGSSTVTEEQRRLYYLVWPWDGKRLVAAGYRFDKQGREISTSFLLDLDGSFEIFHTSNPESDGEYERPRWSAWSYDSTKLVLAMRQNTVRGWTTDPEFQNTRTTLTIYDVNTKTFREVLAFNEEFDRKQIGAPITWSPDSRSMLLTIEKIVSADENISQPDIFRLDLPPELVSPEAALYNGPPIGNQAANAADRGDTPSLPPITAENTPSSAIGRASGEIVAIVEPRHMTVAAIEPLIPKDYQQYLSADTSRNLFVFVGPAKVHKALLADLEVIDFPAAHIVVDLLAVETSDAVNRKLGLDVAYSKGRFSVIQPEGLGVRDLTPGFSVVPPTGIGGVSELLTGSAEGAAALARRFDVDGITDLALGGLGTFPNGGQSFYQGVGKLPREFFVRLDSLARNGEVTILANPRTVATSGKESVIQIRRTVNFFFTEGVNFTTGTPNVRKSDVTATTEGRITPTLLANGKIHMIVDVNVGTVTFGAEDLPEQTDRKAVTEVTVNPGETISIGGLRQQEFKLTKTRVPILGFLPGIGKFFTKTARETRHSVLTILITPYVLGEQRKPFELPDPHWIELEMDERYKVPIMDDQSINAGEKDSTRRSSKKEEKPRRNGLRMRRID